MKRECKTDMAKKSSSKKGNTKKDVSVMVVAVPKMKDSNKNKKKAGK
jgi:hypothetical protein